MHKVPTLYCKAEKHTLHIYATAAQCLHLRWKNFNLTWINMSSTIKHIHFPAFAMAITGTATTNLKEPCHYASITRRSQRTNRETYYCISVYSTISGKLRDFCCFRDWEVVLRVWCCLSSRSAATRTVDLISSVHFSTELKQCYLKMFSEGLDWICPLVQRQAPLGSGQQGLGTNQLER